ncbi:Aldo/keto reductase [Cystobasidium minutum MCA 4210]|uniref:Aldo/keto reductase n=1 Tax=Cystobasidium minutum MCA 4210 TaxID=1397322 RepID=UPI0034CE06C0|eukprot:jgi/Rhomi1/47078/CE47077_8689
MSSDAPASFNPGKMQFTNLGRTGLKVSIFSYGGWLTVGGTQKGAIVKDLIKTAWDNGINFFDNAEIYSNGQSEIEMGNAFKELNLNRDELVIQTKVYFGTGRKDPNQSGLSRKHIIEGVKASAKRLQVDVIDSVLCHRPASFRAETSGVPMEEIVRAFNYLIDQGLIYYWGTSEWSAAELKEAWLVADKLNMVGPIIEQPQYNMFHRQKVDVDFLPLFEQRGMGTTIWSPLASGLLTGKYNEGVPSGSRFDNHKDFFGDTVKSLQSEEGKAKIAEKLGGTMTHLALAWCAVNPGVSNVILGATKVEQLEDNLKALDLIPKLTPEVLGEIEEVLQTKPEGAKTLHA